jgi:hypothetical protein
MKFDITSTPSFKPVSFTIVMETQEELDRWGSVMNSRIYYVLRGLNLIPEGAWKLMEKAGANVDDPDNVVGKVIKTEFNLKD